jgi:hypothetical protein
VYDTDLEAALSNLIRSIEGRAGAGAAICEGGCSGPASDSGGRDNSES